MLLLKDADFLILAALSLCVTLYYLTVYAKLCREQKSGKAGKKPGISLIVCARNEARIITKHVEELIRQKYSDFEIIVVDDRSWDGTQNHVKLLESKYPDKVRLVTVQENNYQWPGKKFAITLGVRAAKNEHIVLCEANCIPAGEYWLDSFAEAFGQGKDIVISYSCFEKAKSFLDKLEDADNLISVKNYLSLALCGLPLFGTPRNFGFTKTVFMQNNGYMNNMKIIGGEADLFLQENAVKANTAVLYNPSAVVLKARKKSLKDFFIMKKKQYNVFRFYNFKAKFFSLFFPLMLSAYYIFAVAGLMKHYDSHIYWTISVLPVLTAFTVDLMISLRLKQTALSILSILVAPLLIPARLALMASSYFSSRNRWRR